MRLQILGRRAQHHPGAGQPFADQGRAGQGGNADGHVVALLHQVHHPVGQRHIQLHLGVKAPKNAPQGRQVQDAKGHRRVDAQQPAGVDAARGEFGLGLGHAAEQLFAARVKHLPFFGQREPSGGAVQQAHAQARLQLGYIARHRRFGQRQGLSRFDKAAGIHHGGEGLHFQKTVHCAAQRNNESHVSRFILD